MGNLAAAAHFLNKKIPKGLASGWLAVANSGDRMAASARSLAAIAKAGLVCAAMVKRRPWPDLRQVNAFDKQP